MATYQKKIQGSLVINRSRLIDEPERHGVCPSKVALTVLVVLVGHHSHYAGRTLKQKNGAYK